MNTNSYDKIYEPIVKDLEKILYQIINYSSISINNIRKILLIIYNQKSLITSDKIVDNLIDTILFHFTPDIKIYNDEIDEFKDTNNLINLFLNNNFNYLIERTK